MLNVLKVANLKETVSAVVAANTARGIQEVGRQILNPPAAAFGRGNRCADGSVAGDSRVAPQHPRVRRGTATT